MAEHRTPNPKVGGSSPSWPAIFLIGYKFFSMKKVVLKKESEVENKETFINKGIKFLKEVKIEAKKITWPQRKQVLMTSLMVIIFSLFIGAYLGILDVVYNFIISFLVR